MGIGWGIGWAPLDFTGFSGHAMFAAALMPLLLRLAAGPGSRRGRLVLQSLPIVLIPFATLMVTFLIVRATAPLALPHLRRACT